MEYKSVQKYLNKNKKPTKQKHTLYKFIIRLFICILIVLGTLIFLKYDKNGKQIIYKYLYENNINFATINNWYQEHFGDILPFQNTVKEKTKLVFNENLVYKDASI